jgi:Myb-like DNA-binding domain
VKRSLRVSLRKGILELGKAVLKTLFFAPRGNRKKERKRKGPVERESDRYRLTLSEREREREGRMGHQCCSKQKVKRGLWSPEEDERLLKYITTHGHGCWSAVPKLAGKSPPLPVSLTHRETRPHSLTARMISYFFLYFQDCKGVGRVAG